MENSKDNQRNFTDQLIGFPKKYPVIWNLILIVVSAFILIWISLSVLDVWTLHGKEEVSTITMPTTC